MLDGECGDFEQALEQAAQHGPTQRSEVLALNEYVDRVAERPTIAASAIVGCTT